MKTLARTVAAVAAVVVAPALALADMAGAEVVDASGTVIGTVEFEQMPTGVLIYVALSGLPPGPHGIHLHAAGTCSPDFSAAGGHINPDQRAHGLRNPDGPDNGDLPNLYVAADGTAMAEFFTTRVSLTGDTDLPVLLDEDGSAVIIHDQPDDHFTQPIGGAGGRIACGVIVDMPEMAM